MDMDGFGHVTGMYVLDMDVFGHMTGIRDWLHDMNEMYAHQC